MEITCNIDMFSNQNIRHIACTDPVCVISNTIPTKRPFKEEMYVYVQKRLYILANSSFPVKGGHTYVFSNCISNLNLIKSKVFCSF